MTARIAQRYDTTTIVLHWIMVLLVLILWGGARALDGAPKGEVHANARSLHIMLGLLFGAMGAARLIWRLSFGRPLPPSDKGWMGMAAKATHNGLYALLAAMVFTGILLAFTGGDSFFNQFSPGAPEADTRALAAQLRGVHDLIGWAIVALAGLHSGAVLYHRLVLRDGVLGRMLPGAPPQT